MLINTYDLFDQDCVPQLSKNFLVCMDNKDMHCRYLEERKTHLGCHIYLFASYL